MTDTYRAGVRMRRVGRELRSWRERIGITNAEACKRARWPPSKLSKIENAQQPIQGVEVLALGLVYDVPDLERNRLFNACLTAGDPGWWQQYDENALVPAVQDYVELESEADLVQTFKPDLIPGLLQTERYATELAMAMADRPSEDTARQRAQVRATRQTRLTDDEPLRVEAVIWEPALRQEVGGPNVMGRQLDRLLELAKLSNVTVQVLPLGSGAHPALGSSSTVLSFVEEHYADVAYVESLTQGIYVEDPADVEVYRVTLAALREVALDPDRSVALIAKIAEDLKH